MKSVESPAARPGRSPATSPSTRPGCGRDYSRITSARNLARRTCAGCTASRIRGSGSFQLSCRLVGRAESSTPAKGAHGGHRRLGPPYKRNTASTTRVSRSSPFTPFLLLPLLLEVRLERPHLIRQEHERVVEGQVCLVLRVVGVVLAKSVQAGEELVGGWHQ